MVTSASHEMTVSAGSDVMLRCDASGIPTPTISWYYKAGRELKDLNKEGSLFSMKSVSREEGGIYVCEADNKVRPAMSLELKVDVLFRPEIEIPYKEIRPRLGSDALLDCVVFSNPPANVTWQKVSGNVILSSDKYQLETWRMNSLIYNSVRSILIRDFSEEDSGKYKCTAVSDLGEDSGIVLALANNTEGISDKVADQDISSASVVALSAIIVVVIITYIISIYVVIIYYRKKLHSMGTNTVNQPGRSYFGYIRTRTNEIRNLTRS